LRCRFVHRHARKVLKTYSESSFPDGSNDTNFVLESSNDDSSAQNRSLEQSGNGDSECLKNCSSLSMNETAMQNVWKHHFQSLEGGEGGTVGQNGPQS
jgi:hypothetical protein